MSRIIRILAFQKFIFLVILVAVLLPCVPAYAACDSILILAGKTYCGGWEDSDSDGYFSNTHDFVLILGWVATLADCNIYAPCIAVSDTVGNDCDDTNPNINPMATEWCGDGINNDCDGMTDEPSCIPPSPPPSDPPAAPSNLTATVISHDAITLTWQDNSNNEDGFIIERSDGINGWKRLTTVGPGVTSYTNSGLRWSWKYYYRVSAYNATDSSGFSDSASDTTWFHPYERCNGATLSSRIIDENSPPGTVVGVFGTIEPTGTHRYEFWTPTPFGHSNGKFRIEGNRLVTGEGLDPDFERRNEYRISIKSIDTELGYQWCFQEFDLTVTDLPEPPHGLRLTGYSGIPENLPVGTVVASFMTEDEPGDTGHTYSLVAGEGDTDNGRFTISGTTLKTGSFFDYEAGSSVSIRVRTDDGANGSFTKVFTLSVRDASDAPILSQIPNQSTDDEVPVTVSFTVSDQDTDVQRITLSAVSDSQEVLPDGNLVIAGSGGNRTLTLTPVVGQAGTVAVTLSAGDSVNTTVTSFMLFVTTGGVLRTSSAVTTEAGDGTVPPGGTLTYTAEITNEGDREVSDVQFSMPLPGETEYVPLLRRSDSGLTYDAASHSVEWTGDIAAGDAAEIFFRVRVSPGVFEGDGIAFAPAEVSYENGGADTGLISAAPTALTEISVAGCLPGDVNADGEIDLEDVLESLRAVIGTEADLCPEADTDGDEKIGLAEAVFLLQEIAR